MADFIIYVFECEQDWIQTIDTGKQNFVQEVSLPGFPKSVLVCNHIKSLIQKFKVFITQFKTKTLSCFKELFQFRVIQRKTSIGQSGLPNLDQTVWQPSFYSRLNYIFETLSQHFTLLPFSPQNLKVNVSPDSSDLMAPLILSPRVRSMTGVKLQCSSHWVRGVMSCTVIRTQTSDNEDKL